MRSSFDAYVNVGGLADNTLGSINVVALQWVRLVFG